MFLVTLLLNTSKEQSLLLYLGMDCEMICLQSSDIWAFDCTLCTSKNQSEYFWVNNNDVMLGYKVKYIICYLIGHDRAGDEHHY